MSRLHFHLALSLLCLGATASTWAAWGSRLAKNAESLTILATAASLVTSIVGLVLGLSLAGPRRHEVEAGHLRRLNLTAFILLGAGLLTVACATVAPLDPRFGAFALGFGVALGFGTYVILLGVLASHR